MPLSIKTNQLKTRKRVEIDGHPFVVRRRGNIETLDVNQYLRRLNALALLESKSKDGLSEAEVAEVDDLSKKLTDIFVAQFDDGGDQSKSRALVSSLSADELGILLEQIFTSDEAEDVAADTHA